MAQMLSNVGVWLKDPTYSHTFEYLGPTGGPVWVGSGGVSLLEEVYYWKQALRLPTTCTIPSFLSFASYLQVKV